jgi:glycosyltransferase involved in cell wall biosynthesis
MTDRIIPDGVPPTLSVVIPTCNRPALLAEAVRSVVDAVAGSTVVLQVIVVDDGEQPGASDIAAAHGATFLRGSGVGVSAARNLGLAAATGAYVGFLDDDDVWVAGYPIAQLQLLAARPEIDAVVSRMMMGDDQARPVFGPLPPEPLDDSASMYRQFLDYVPVVGSLLVRRAAVDRVGGFDTGLVGAEDWDWGLRLARTCDIAAVTDVAIVLRQHGQGRARSLEAEYDVNRRRCSDTFVVFRRGCADIPIAARVRLVRRWIELRGWWSHMFAELADRATAGGDRRTARRAIVRSVVLSPPAAAKRRLVR